MQSLPREVVRQASAQVTGARQRVRDLGAIADVSVSTSFTILTASCCEAHPSKSTMVATVARPRSCFVLPGTFVCNNGASPTLVRLSSRPASVPLCMCAKSSKSKPGLFGRLRDTILRPIVTVPGSGAQGSLVDCPFCKTTGKNDCTGCKGTGKDPMGTCLMCDGKKMLTCTVCDGVGVVDRVRRGGTDGKGEYLGRKSK